MKNDGKEAERSFEAYWNVRGHCQRLRDKKDLMGLNGGRPLADFAKPSDFLVSSAVDPLHYAEVKSTVDAKTFSFSKIQDGQSAAAIKEAKRGSKAYWFYIFSYSTGRWYVMNCVQYAALIDAGKRSVKFEDLEPWTQ